MRTLPLLLVDLGNTSVGAALLEERVADVRVSGAQLTRLTFGVAGLAEPDGGFDALVARFAAAASARAADPGHGASATGAERGARIWMSSVQRPAVAAQVDDVLRRHGLGPARVNAPSGLALALRNPETCGFDRQYAARAALVRTHGPALVVSAGTALTVDAVVPWGDPHGPAALAKAGPARGIGGIDAVAAQRAAPAGVFLGGAIAPGPQLLADALARGGARLFAVDSFGADVPALGRDSASALRAGIVHGFCGAARALVERVGAEAGLERAPIWLTGGAAPLLREALAAAFGARVGEAPALVLEGLASAALDAGAPADEAAS